MKEEWRKIPGYQSTYEVSNIGDVKSIQYDKILKTQSTNDYLSVVLYKSKKPRRKIVHRLVYEAFVGKIPDNLQIDHIDRNKQNNYVSNLRLANSFENQFNRYARRTACYGKNKDRWGYATRIFGQLFFKKGFSSEEEAFLACEKLREKHLLEH